MPSRPRCSVKRMDVLAACVGVVGQLVRADGLALSVAVPQSDP